MTGLNGTESPIDLGQAKVDIEERKRAMRQAEDRADQVLAALFEALASEDAVEALRTTLTGIFLEGGSTADALDAHFPHVVNGYGDAGIQGMLEELVRREDPSATMVDIGKIQLSTTNDISRRLHAIEKMLAAGGLVVKPAPSAALSPAQPDTSPAGTTDGERTQRELMTDNAALVSTQRDYVAADPALNPAPPRRAAKRRGPPKLHEELRGTSWDKRCTAIVRNLARDECLKAGRLLSMDNIRKAVLRADIDLSGYGNNLIRNAVRNSFLRFGQDGWWPSGPEIPSDVTHRQVRIPPLKSWRAKAVKAVSDMNDLRRLNRKPLCELTYAGPVTKTKPKGDKGAGIAKVAAAVIPKVPRRPTRGVAGGKKTG